MCETNLRETIHRCQHEAIADVTYAILIVCHKDVFVCVLSIYEKVAYLFIIPLSLLSYLERNGVII